MSDRRAILATLLAAISLMGHPACSRAGEAGDQVSIGTSVYCVDDVCYVLCYGLDGKGNITFIAWESLQGGGPAKALRIVIAKEPALSTAHVIKDGKKLILNDSHTIVGCADGVVQAEVDFPEGKVLTEAAFNKFRETQVNPLLDAKQIAKLFK